MALKIMQTCAEVTFCCERTRSLRHGQWDKREAIMHDRMNWPEG